MEDFDCRDQAAPALAGPLDSKPRARGRLDRGRRRSGPACRGAGVCGQPGQIKADPNRPLGRALAFRRSRPGVNRRGRGTASGVWPTSRYR